jgi:hypothetical protein
MLNHRARALFLFTGFFAIQASALWSALCALPRHHAPSSALIAAPAGGPAGMSDAMSGMSMRGTPADDDRERIATETSEPGSPAAPDNGPCDHATAPQDCAAMTVCSTVFVSSSVASPEVGALPARIAVTTVLAPLSFAFPPDFPPPRA